MSNETIEQLHQRLRQFAEDTRETAIQRAQLVLDDEEPCVLLGPLECQLNSIDCSLEQDILERLMMYEAEEAETILSEALRFRNMSDEEFQQFCNDLRNRPNRIFPLSKD